MPRHQIRNVCARHDRDSAEWRRQPVTRSRKAERVACSPSWINRKHGQSEDSSACLVARERASEENFPIADPESLWIDAFDIAIPNTSVAHEDSDYRPTCRYAVGVKRQPLQPPLGIAGGAMCGMISAILYTAANVALRDCVGIDPFLVTAVKATPTVLLLTPVLLGMLVAGQSLATSTQMVPRFIAVALIGQFVGNAAFQLSLEVIGLAATVPITLGVLIICGAVLGRLILHEPVRLPTIVAMITLIVAVVVLSIPESTRTPPKSISNLPPWGGALCAAASGAAYALFGVVLRQTMTGGVSASLTLFISGAVGTISLWSVTFVHLGVEPLLQISSNQWGVMIAAGVLNFTAFAALSLSLKSLPVVAVNLINASQVAMAAVAGVAMFAEPVTNTLVAGIVLTFIGLFALAGGRRR